jgi:hypothetical protein
LLFEYIIEENAPKVNKFENICGQKVYCVVKLLQRGDTVGKAGHFFENKKYLQKTGRRLARVQTFYGKKA